MTNVLGERKTAEVGDELPSITVRITRADLVHYAGASLDFNPIHWNERFAAEVGLPGVIAHGMLTMALANRIVTDWLGDPGALVECSARFAKIIHVPDDEHGVEIEFTGRVGQLREDGTARLDLTAKVDGVSMLGKTTAVVRLA
jgi:acyl dehydratase